MCDEKNPAKLFYNCITHNYITVKNRASFAVDITENEMFIYFEKSNGSIDWINNLNFPKKPYKNMDSVWYCHRGFFKVWKSIEPYIEKIILNCKVKNITVVGYSHGAALAAFCHEYIWFHRPDLRDNLHGYGFGCPKIYWGEISDDMKKRWQNFTVVRNIDDLVTHLPPEVFGFHHIGNVYEIGKKGNYNRINAHRDISYFEQLL